MIIKGDIKKDGKLVLEVQNEVLEFIDKVEQKVQKKFGAIYRGQQLIWRTIYNAVKSCFGSGTWLGEKPWLGDDPWKNN